MHKGTTINLQAECKHGLTHRKHRRTHSAGGAIVSTPTPSGVLEVEAQVESRFLPRKWHSHGDNDWSSVS